MVFEPLRRVEIPNDEPYKNDALQHRKTSEALTAIIRHTPGPTTMSIDGPWGCGKTTLLRMWTADMARQNQADPAKSPRVIYFNVWATQGFARPLLALLGQVAKDLQPTERADQEVSETLRSLRTKAMIAGKAVLPVVLKGVAGKLLGTETIPEVAEKLTEVGVASWGEQQQSVEDFRTKLSTLAARVGGAGPLVIAVDELDRCRPTYAIEFLETLEHLFSVQGVVFVLAMNKQQLAHSVRGVYGSTFDAAGYLRRFIDVDFPMPEPPVENYIDMLFRAMGFEDLLRNVQEGYRGAFDQVVEVVTVFRLSLRDINQLMQRLKIVLHQDPLMWVELTVFLLALRELQPGLYEVIAQHRPGEFMDQLAQRLQQPDFVNRRSSVKIEALLLLAHAKVIDRDERDALVRKYKETDSDRARGVVHIYERHGEIVNLEDYRQRVEFASRFRFSD